MVDAPNAFTSFLAALAIVVLILLGGAGAWALLTYDSGQRELTIEIPDNRNR